VIGGFIGDSSALQSQIVQTYAKLDLIKIWVLRPLGW